MSIKSCKCGETNWVGSGVIHSCERCEICNTNAEKNIADAHDFDYKKIQKYIVENDMNKKIKINIRQCVNCGYIELVDD